MMITNNAEELKDLERWVCCNKDGVFNPANSKFTKSLNNVEWLTYQNAWELINSLHESAENDHLETENLPTNIAFVLNNEYTAITISNSSSEDRTLEAYAEPIINDIRSYTEETKNRVVIICEASIEDNARHFREYTDGTTILVQNIGYVPITYKTSGSYDYGPDNCVTIECRTEEVKDLIDNTVNSGLRWEKYGAHYRCETNNNDISFWCFELSNGLFNPIVFAKEKHRFDIHSLKNRYSEILPLFRAKAVCVKWLEELIQLEYDVSEWLRTKR